MNKKTIGIASAFVGAAVLGVSAGTTYSLWSQEQTTGAGVQMATASLSITGAGQTSTATAGSPNVSINLGGATDAATLLNTGWMFYTVDETYYFQGGAVDLSADPLATTAGTIFGDAQKKTWWVDSNTPCDASSWDAATTVGTNLVSPTDGTDTTTTTKKLCVAFKYVPTKTYTNVGTVTGTASNGATVTDNDSWTVNVVPDPTKDQTFKFTITPTYEDVCVA